jgi:hypothetical protein
VNRLFSSKDFTFFLLIAISVTTYVTNFSGSQSLIELNNMHLSNSKFLENDLLIYSYQDNIHKFFSNYFFYFFYQFETFGFLNSLFFVNIVLKTFTVYGLYLCYLKIINNSTLALFLSLAHLSPVFSLLPLIGDWYIVGQNLHANSIFYCLFVFIVFSLLNRNYFSSYILQIFALLSHPILGLFLSLPLIIIFRMIESYKFLKLASSKRTNLYNFILVIFSLSIHIFIGIQLLSLDKNFINSETLINISNYHAPHHYMVSSFNIYKILYYYLFAFIGLLFFLRHEKNQFLLANIKIISLFIFFFPPLHFLFTEIFYSKIIFSMHILRSASNLSIIFLAPYVLVGLNNYLVKSK